MFNTKDAQNFLMFNAKDAELYKTWLSDLGFISNIISSFDIIKLLSHRLATIANIVAQQFWSIFSQAADDVTIPVWLVGWQ